MSWPNSQDYNEAIQNASSFADPGLKGGQVEVNNIGLPVPRSGNFADVYKFRDAAGTFWAVKCFTRKVSGLQERYAKISEHVAKASFPFTVGFQYLEQGIRVRGQWFPLLKMEWVEGFTLNEFVRDNALKPQYLHALTQMWAKLCGRLRDSNFAHADLQHGNVLLVPATSGSKLQLRLIDYDGMWVPALADAHSGEVGHPNFQHPLRLKDRLYNADVDRFPHLVIAAALRATLIGGKPLFDHFDNGDNLLFKEADLREPANSEVFKALWGMGDDVLCTLVGKMALASKEPLRKTPWLDDVLLGDESRLSAEEEKKVLTLLGVKPHFTASQDVAAPKSPNAPAMEEFNDFAGLDEGDGAPAPSRAKPRAKKPAPKQNERPPKSRLPYYVGGGVATVALIGLAVALLGGKKDPAPTPAPEVAKQDGRTDQGPPTKKDPTPPAKKDETVVEKKDPVVVEKKDPPDIEKKDPVELTKQDPTDLPEAGGAEPNRLWKKKYSTHREVAFTNDMKSLLAVPAGEKRIEKLATADGSQSAEAGPFDGVFNIVSGPGGMLWVKEKVGNKEHLTAWDANTLAKKYEMDDSARITLGWPHADGKSMVFPLPLSTDLGVFSIADGSRTGTLKSPALQGLGAVASTADGATVALQGLSGTVYIKSAADADWVAHETNLPKGGAHRVAVSRDRFAVVATGNAIQVFDSANGNPVSRMNGHGGAVTGVQFAADPRMLVSASQDGTMRLWDVATGKELQKYDLGGRAKSLTVSPDGRLAAVPTNYPEGLQVWRLPDAAKVAPPEVVKKDPAEVAKKDPPAGGLKPLKQVWKVARYATDVTFSPDGKQVMSNGPKGVTVFDAASSAPTAFEIIDQSINHFAYCDNGKFVIGTLNEKGKQSEVFVWDSATKQRLATINDLYFKNVSVAPKAGKFAALLLNGSIGIFSGSDGSLVETVQVSARGAVVQLAPDGEAVVARLSSGVVLARPDKSSPMKAAVKPPPEAGPIPNLCLSPDGKCLATYVFNQPDVKVFDLATGERKQLLTTDGQKVTFATFSPDGRYLLAAISGRPAIAVWDAQSGRSLGDFEMPHLVRRFDFSPDGKLLTACFYGQNLGLGVWQVPDGAFEGGPASVPPEMKDPAAVKSPEEPKKTPTVVGAAPTITSVWVATKKQNSGTLAFTGDSAAVGIHDARAGRLLTFGAASNKQVSTDKTSNDPSSSAVTGPGAVIYLRNNRSKLVAWDVQKHEAAFELDGVGETPANSAYCDLQANLLYLPRFNNGREIAVFNATDGKQKTGIPLPDGFNLLRAGFSGDAKTIVIVDNKGHLMRKNGGTDWRPVGDLEVPNSKAFRMCLSPDGSHLAVASGAEPIQVIDVSTGKRRPPLKGHTGDVTRLCFTGDGRWLLSTSDDMTLRMWDWANGREVQKLATSAAAHGLALSRDGKLLATTTRDEGLQLWAFSKPTGPPPKMR